MWSQTLLVLSAESGDFPDCVTDRQPAADSGLPGQTCSWRTADGGCRANSLRLMAHARAHPEDSGVLRWVDWY